MGNTESGRKLNGERLTGVSNQKKKKEKVVLLEVPRESQSSEIRERASASGEFD